MYGAAVAPLVGVGLGVGAGVCAAGAFEGTGAGVPFPGFSTGLSMNGVGVAFGFGVGVGTGGGVALIATAVGLMNVSSRVATWNTAFLGMTMSSPLRSASKMKKYGTNIVATSSSAGAYPFFWF